MEPMWNGTLQKLSADTGIPNIPDLLIQYPYRETVLAENSPSRKRTSLTWATQKVRSPCLPEKPLYFTGLWTWICSGRATCRPVTKKEPACMRNDYYRFWNEHYSHQRETRTSLSSFWLLGYQPHALVTIVWRPDSRRRQFQYHQSDS